MAKWGIRWSWRLTILGRERKAVQKKIAARVRPTERAVQTNCQNLPPIRQITCDNSATPIAHRHQPALPPKHRRIYHLQARRAKVSGVSPRACNTSANVGFKPRTQAEIFICCLLEKPNSPNVGPVCRLFWTLALTHGAFTRRLGQRSHTPTLHTHQSADDPMMPDISVAGARLIRSTEPNRLSSKDRLGACQHHGPRESGTSARLLVRQASWAGFYKTCLQGSDMLAFKIDDDDDATDVAQRSASCSSSGQ